MSVDQVPLDSKESFFTVTMTAEKSSVTNDSVHELDASSLDEENQLDNTLLISWNAPQNQENPKNWSNCKAMMP